MYQNYPNLKNVFNQVGLVSIQCFGIDFTANNINGLYPRIELPIDHITKPSLFPEVKKKEFDDSMLDEVCILKLKELKDALEICKKIENYEQAQKIHELMQLVRKLGIKINDAKEIKDKALEMDDFETCHTAKKNIDILREKVRSIDVGYILNKQEEETKVDVGTQPMEEEFPEKEPVKQEMAVKAEENGDEDESVRETMKYNE